MEAATRKQLALPPKRRGPGRGVEESLRFSETQVKISVKSINGKRPGRGRAMDAVSTA